MERITSRQNPLITRLRRLGAEKTRRAMGVFLCEGPSWWGGPALGRRRSCWRWRRDRPRRAPAGVRVVEVRRGLCRRCPPWRHPQGMGVCRTPDTAPAGDAAGGPPAGAGRCRTRQRGHRLAHRRRLRGGGLFHCPRRALCPQDGARHWGPASACRCGRGRWRI